MDVARYADTDGFEQDYVRPNAWRYRDYVIDAFNDDKPYNQFLREQIAGDELDHVTDETRIATGFLRAGPRVNFREKDNPERRHDYLDDVLATVGRGVLGMTVHCARCHDHKFDPILQKDYYSMQASIFGYVEIDYPLLDRPEADAYFDAMRAIDERQQPLRDRVERHRGPLPRGAPREDDPRALPGERAGGGLQAGSRAHARRAAPGRAGAHPQSAAAAGRGCAERGRQGERGRAPGRRLPRCRISGRRPLRWPHIVTDGDYRFAPDGPGDNVIGCPECRTPPDVEGDVPLGGGGQGLRGAAQLLPHSRRPVQPGLGDAAGLPDRRHLRRTADPASAPRRAHGPAAASPSPSGSPRATTRSRRGSPSTASGTTTSGGASFGRSTTWAGWAIRPTHPALLDWLAVEFMDRGWSVKELHRLLMTSEAYRMASAFPHEANAAADPENNLLWRYRPQRIEAEILRDSIMTVSGGIDLTVGGPPVFPHIPSDILFQSDGKGFWCGSPEPGAADHGAGHRYLVRGAGPPGGLAPQRLRLPAPVARLPVLRHLRPAGSEPDGGGAQRLDRLDAGADADEQTRSS